MIYEPVNQRSEILPSATSHIAHVCNQFDHVFALRISMRRFKSINFCYFCKKYKVFERWGLRPQSPTPAPPLQISGCAPHSNYSGPFLIHDATVVNRVRKNLKSVMPFPSIFEINMLL